MKFSSLQHIAWLFTGSSSRRAPGVLPAKTTTDKSGGLMENSTDDLGLISADPPKPGCPMSVHVYGYHTHTLSARDRNAYRKHVEQGESCQECVELERCLHEAIQMACDVVTKHRLLCFNPLVMKEFATKASSYLLDEPEDWKYRWVQPPIAGTCSGFAALSYKVNRMEPKSRKVYESHLPKCPNCQYALREWNNSVCALKAHLILHPGEEQLIELLNLIEPQYIKHLDIEKFVLNGNSDDVPPTKRPWSFSARLAWFLHWRGPRLNS